MTPGWLRMNTHDTRPNDPLSVGRLVHLLSLIFIGVNAVLVTIGLPLSKMLPIYGNIFNRSSRRHINKDDPSQNRPDELNRLYELLTIKGE